jgi:hypothetical protein
MFSAAASSSLERLVHASHRKDAHVFDWQPQAESIVRGSPIVVRNFAYCRALTELLPRFPSGVVAVPTHWKRIPAATAGVPCLARPERRNVPVYNARLNSAVLAFHEHIIQDGHYLVTNCSLCRKHLSQIKSYSKKLDQAMK